MYVHEQHIWVHPITAPQMYSGYPIVTSIYIPDETGTVPNRYAILAYNDRRDTYMTTVIVPRGISENEGFYGLQGHYDMDLPTALESLAKHVRNGQ